MVQQPTGPLAGIKIVELGGIGPGPFCCMLLSDLGADIIRIDRPSPSDGGAPVEARFDLLNRGRRSAAMDLKQPEAVAAVLRLVSQRKRVVEAVKDVSFEVRAGQTLGIVGESGSGKSTIGKCLLKLIGNDGGVMAFEGRDIAPMSERAFRPLRCHIQMIFQDPFASLNPRHTVGKILCDGPLASGVPRAQAEARARELLKLVELDASAFDRYPAEFSGGQRQRIGIARALAMEPRLIVADESVSALDVSVQAQVLRLLADVQKRLGIALIFITHDLRVAAQICDKVLVMHRGTVVEQGSPADIFLAPQHAYTRKLIDAMPGKDWDPQAVHTAVAADALAMEAS